MMTAADWLFVWITLGMLLSLIGCMSYNYGHACGRLEEIDNRR